jgi:hypothetical protein
MCYDDGIGGLWMARNVPKYATEQVSGDASQTSLSEGGKMTGLTGKRGTIVLALAGALLAAPSIARATPSEGLNFDNYCTLGAMRVCASVRLQSVGNTLSMQVWNLQGSMGSTSTINAIALYHTGSGFAGSVASYGVHYVQNGHQTNIKPYWNLGGGDLSIGTHGNNGISGCTNPGGKNAVHWSTCNSFPGVPYVQFDFAFGANQHFGLNGVGLAWNAIQVPRVGDAICVANVNCVDPAPSSPGANVTPEPVTMALLATGLAGMGGGALTRRRKRAAEKTAD